MDSPLRLTVLVAQRDAQGSDLCTHYLATHDFDVVTSSDGPATLRALRSGVDAAIVSLDLPVIDGVSIVRISRREGIETPILAYDAKSSEAARTLAFEVGADDYVGVATSAMHIVYRIQALLRRRSRRAARKERDQTLRFGSWEFDEAARDVRVGGIALNLRPREFALFFGLARRPNAVLSRDALMQTVCGRDYESDERTVDQHVRRIRRKAAAITERPLPLATVYGVGYKFSTDLA